MRNSIFICVLMAFGLMSCRKDWLEERSNNAIVIPNTLKDLQAILDNTRAMNGNTLNFGVTPSLGETSSDDYFVNDNIQASIARIEDKNAYTWNDNIFEGGGSLSWEKGYTTVFYANTVLDALVKLAPLTEHSTEYNNIKGSALFYRAHSFFHLAQIFSKQYEPTIAATELGIPLRLSSDFNEATKRSTMAETYKQIISDLKNAYELLPKTQSAKTRPSKAAASGLLARVYLLMGDFASALDEANKCLAIQNQLMDFSSLNITATLPFERFNVEVIFDASMANSLTISNHIIVDSLYKKYDNLDSRKTAYFRTVSGSLKFKGSYTRSATVMFSGIATDEVYLIRAECLARLGDLGGAMTDVNFLLTNRYSKINGTSTYVPKVADNVKNVLKIIFEERRKELVFRGLRWMDLRRLNKDGMNILLTRVVDGKTHKLDPASLKYTFSIPDNVIALTGIEQNKR